MDTKDKSQFSKTFLIIMGLLLILAIFIWYRISANQALDETLKAQQQSEAAAAKFSNLKLDTEVLDDLKFKELRALPKAVFEPLGGAITVAELSRVARRKANPFKAF